MNLVIVTLGSYVGVIGDVCPGCGRKAYEGVPIERVNDYKNSCNC